MRLVHTIVLAGALAAVDAPALAETIESGGDLFATGMSARAAEPATRDLFASGGRVGLQGPVAGDAHASGFDVEVGAAVEGDLYAMGGSVRVRGPVGGDATMMGGSVTLEDGASVGGNARLSGGTVSVEAPIAGSLLSAGGEVILAAPVEGDVTVAAGTLTFEDGARIDGRLLHAGPEQVAVPASVIDPGRVTFERIAGPGAEEGGGVGVVPTGWGALGAFAVALGFVVALGAVLLAFAPRGMAGLRRRASRQPWLSLLLGAVGLAALMGLVPVGAMTIVGLPLVPVAVLAVVAVWILGYLLGTYAVAMRVAEALGAGPAPAIWVRLTVLALGMTVAVALNLVPVLGWLVNLALILLGVGAMTAAVLERTVPDPDPPYDDEMGPVGA